MSGVINLHRITRTASLRKVTWRPGAKSWYAFDIRAIGAAVPPAQLQEAHA